MAPGEDRPAGRHLGDRDHPGRDGLDLPPGVPGACRDGPRDLELWGIYLLAEYHGSGIGQALLDAAVGDRPASLWVAEDNPRARAFYSRNGFEPDGGRRVEEEWEHMVVVRLVR